MTNFIGTAANDEFLLTPDRDLIAITPGGGHDIISGFDSGSDLLVLNEFGFIGPDSVIPFFTSDQETVSLTLDLSAAQGQEPGLQTVFFTDTFGVADDDIVFNIGVPPDDEPEVTRIEPDDGLPTESSQLKPLPELPVEDIFIPEVAFTPYGPYIQSEHPLWWYLH